MRLLEAQYTQTVLIMGKYDYPMPNNPAYLEFVTGLLSPLGSITARSMMGGHVLYCDAIVFALIANNTLYLKADAETRPRFEELGRSFRSKARPPCRTTSRRRSSLKPRT